jgi:hypothetical protein
MIPTPYHLTLPTFPLMHSVNAQEDIQEGPVTFQYPIHITPYVPTHYALYVPIPH